MELIGAQRGDVAALSASATNDTSFASLCSNGTVSLWDVRLKKKNYMIVPPPPKRVEAGDATEVLYAADRNLVVVLCDREIRFVDVRKRMETLAVYTHTSEMVRFVSGTHPVDRRTTLAIDEEGCIVPLDLLTLQPTSLVEDWVFGIGTSAEADAADGGRAVFGFGRLSNYCCGMGLVDAGPSLGNKRETRALVTVGMDGRGELFGSAARSTPFELSLDTMRAGGPAQVLNPPLPACCDFIGDRIAVGKADGMYEVLELAEGGGGLETIMAAPGHAHNGLCVVHWTETGRSLLSVSLCGQFTLWDVATFMEGEEDDEADMPPVLAALDHRECVGSQKAVVNAGAALSRDQFLLSDNEGNVTLSRWC